MRKNEKRRGGADQKGGGALYREQIIDHYRHPRNFGKLDACDSRHRESNFSCGDDLEFSLRLKQGKIEELKFQGQGCALSVAAASMLSEKVIGQSVEQVLALSEQDVVQMLGVGPLSGSRLRCACLGLKGIQQAIGQAQAKASAKATKRKDMNRK